jgi:glutamate--cysteine ligase
VAEGRTLAQRRLDAFNGPWGGSVDGAFRDCVIPL